MKKNIGVISMGIKAPIIKEGDDIVDIVVKSVLDATEINNTSSFTHGENKRFNINNKDIIGITESVVARAFGEYITIDEIAEDIKKKFGERANIALTNMIYSRNRFAMILKGIARGCCGGKIYLYMPHTDEVGNVSKNHPFTGIDYTEYYKEIVESENCECIIIEKDLDIYNGEKPQRVIYCGLHDYEKFIDTFSDFKTWYTLADICGYKCDWGLLGSNKASEEKLKLFPNKKTCQKVVTEIQKRIFDITGKNVFVCIYGDGCFKDPVGGIWEFADPVTMPGYTNHEFFESTPNEIKIKYLADDKYSNLNGKELDEAIDKEIKEHGGKNLKASMNSEGTTPRLYMDLLASLMDLTSGSGMRGTPIILVQNYNIF